MASNIPPSAKGSPCTVQPPHAGLQSIRDRRHQFGAQLGAWRPQQQPTATGTGSYLAPLTGIPGSASAAGQLLSTPTHQLGAAQGLRPAQQELGAGAQQSSSNSELSGIDFSKDAQQQTLPLPPPLHPAKVPLSVVPGGAAAAAEAAPLQRKASQHKSSGAPSTPTAGTSSSRGPFSGKRGSGRKQASGGVGSTQTQGDEPSRLDQILHSGFDKQYVESVTPLVMKIFNTINNTARDLAQLRAEAVNHELEHLRDMEHCEVAARRLFVDQRYREASFSVEDSANEMGQASGTTADPTKPAPCSRRAALASMSCESPSGRSVPPHRAGKGKENQEEPHQRVGTKQQQQQQAKEQEEKVEEIPGISGSSHNKGDELSRLNQILHSGFDKQYVESVTPLVMKIFNTINNTARDLAQLRAEAVNHELEHLRDMEHCEVAARRLFVDQRYREASSFTVEDSANEMGQASGTSADPTKPAPCSRRAALASMSCESPSGRSVPPHRAGKGKENQPQEEPHQRVGTKQQQQQAKEQEEKVEEIPGISGSSHNKGTYIVTSVLSQVGLQHLMPADPSDVRNVNQQPGGLRPVQQELGAGAQQSSSISELSGIDFSKDAQQQTETPLILFSPTDPAHAAVQLQTRTHVELAGRGSQLLQPGWGATGQHSLLDLTPCASVKTDGGPVVPLPSPLHPAQLVGVVPPKVPAGEKSPLQRKTKSSGAPSIPAAEASTSKGPSSGRRGAASERRQTREGPTQGRSRPQEGGSARLGVIATPNCDALFVEAMRPVLSFMDDYKNKVFELTQQRQTALVKLIGDEQAAESLAPRRLFGAEQDEKKSDEQSGEKSHEGEGAKGDGATSPEDQEAAAVAAAIACLPPVPSDSPTKKVKKIVEKGNSKR